jgi:spore germination protein GerM
MNADKRFKVLMTGLFFLVIFIAGLAAGYYFFLRTAPADRGSVSAISNRPEAGMAVLQLYFPSEGRLSAEKRQVPRALSRIAIARATVEEFLKGPIGAKKSYVPEGATLLGIYDGEDGILYVDLSGAFRRNLEVDALSEFLLLQSLYESILTNVYGIVDVKILIEGAEVETLGGHVSLMRPLGYTVSQTTVQE